MKSDSVLVTVAIIAVLASLAGLVTNYYSTSNLNNLFTGYATEEGTVNVTINSTTSVEIISANGTEGKSLDWGSGSVETDGYAYLISNGTISGGSWEAIINEGFIIENKGNTNVTLNVSSNVNAETFIGGTNPQFEFNVTNNETGSCTGTLLGTYTSFTTADAQLCTLFQAGGSIDSIRMDILLGIPNDANPGDKVATVYLDYEAAS